MSEFEETEFPPELALVIACARWPVGALDLADIQRRLAGRVDWDLFLEWVRRNRVAPLIHHNIQQAGAIPLPETVGRALRNQAALNARRVLMQIAEAARITRLLSGAGIRSMMVKGPALALLAFGNPTLRESQDVDLLIDPTRVRDADRLIRQAGYERVIPSSELSGFQFRAYQRLQCQFAYDSREFGVTLELHWRLTSNPLLFPLDEAALWNRPEPLNVAGTQFATLPDEELFLYLCAHGSGHMWFRLKWIVDIAALLQRIHPETLERIVSRARTLGIDRSLHLALILAERLLAASVPPPILATAKLDRAARQLAIAACQALAWGGSPAEPVETRWFSTWLNWHAFKLRSDFRYHWNELRIRMLSLEDWARLPLPAWLHPLYVPLRPLAWAMRKLQRMVSRL
jgi:hypothetical protein